ncbi:hypothetical protein BH10BAC5_BH10BAC5_25930 [soil metagenome]
MDYYKLLESIIGFFSLTLMSLISYAYMNDRRNIKVRQDLLEIRQTKFEDQSTSKFERLMENLNDLKVYIEKKFNELHN